MSYINTRDVLGDRATLDSLTAYTLTELREDGVTKLVSYACYHNTGLSYVEMPGITTTKPGLYAFEGCTGLFSASFPNMQRFGDYMFSGCTNLTNIYAPEAIYGGNAVFSGCKALQSVSFPKMSSIGQNMFYECYALSSFTLSTTISSIPASAFTACRAISAISMPNVKVVGFNAFLNCTKLSSVSLPSATTISGSAFYNCPVRKLSFPLVTNIGACITNKATEVDFSLRPPITASAFRYNYDLFNLILRNEEMLTLNNVNALWSTPIANGCGKIYVPANLVDTYKSASNWSTYAAQIEALENYTDGSPTGGDTITDSWATILSNSNYSTDYSVGDTKWVSFNGTYALMQIVAFDRDELADNTGNAHITWLCKGYEATHKMNNTNTSLGGWAASEMRTWLINDALPTIDATVRSGMKTVKKTYHAYDIDATSEDVIWLPSFREVTGTTSMESSGCTYVDFFTDNASRVKYNKWTSYSASQWWLRTGFTSDSFYVVHSAGGTQGLSASAEYGVVFGFCT